jgi:Flp pilus assembly protein TadB
MTEVAGSLTLVAAVLSGLAVWCAMLGPTRPWPAGGMRSTAAAPEDTRTGLHRRLLLSAFAALFPWLVLKDALGVLAATAAAVLTWRWLGSAETREERARRAQLERQLPHLVDLLASTLAVGMSPEAALGRVAAAVEDPGRGALEQVERALRLGRDPAHVWRDLAGHPTLGPLGRTMVRSAQSGAPVADAMHRLAEDHRRVARTEAESRARAVGVRATAPLGVCLLPAFVLVGVVPLVAGFSSTLVGR